MNYLFKKTEQIKLGAVNNSGHATKRQHSNTEAEFRPARFWRMFVGIVLWHTTGRGRYSFRALLNRFSKLWMVEGRKSFLKHVDPFQRSSRDDGKCSQNNNNAR